MGGEMGGGDRADREGVRTNIARITHLSAYLEGRPRPADEAFFRSLVEQAPDPLIVVDEGQRLRYANPAEAVFRQRAAGTINLIEETVGAIRELEWALRPGMLDRCGLGALLEEETERFVQATAVRCRFRDETGEATDDLDPHLATAMFRIFQETLTYIAQGAGASDLEVSLFLDGARLTRAFGETDGRFGSRRRRCLLIC